MISNRVARSRRSARPSSLHRHEIAAFTPVDISVYSTCLENYRPQVLFLRCVNKIFKNACNLLYSTL